MDMAAPSATAPSFFPPSSAASLTLACAEGVSHETAYHNQQQQQQLCSGKLPALELLPRRASVTNSFSTLGLMQRIRSTTTPPALTSTVLPGLFRVSKSSVLHGHGVFCHFAWGILLLCIEPLPCRVAWGSQSLTPRHVYVSCSNLPHRKPHSHIDNLLLVYPLRSKGADGHCLRTPQLINANHQLSCVQKRARCATTAGLNLIIVS